MIKKSNTQSFHQIWKRFPCHKIFDYTSMYSRILQSHSQDYIRLRQTFYRSLDSKLYNLYCTSQFVLVRTFPAF